MTPALWALCAACVVCAVCSGAAGHGYCGQLYDLNLTGSAITSRHLRENGTARTLRLAGSGAAHALLRALLVHTLHYRADDVRLAPDFTLGNDEKRQNELILSVATAWGNERTSASACAAGACSVAGAGLDVLGRGAAPVARRLHARLAPGAQARCARDWQALLRPECGFLNVTETGDALAKYRNLANVAWSSDDACVTFFAGTDEDPATEHRLAHELIRRANSSTPPLPLCFEKVSDADLREKLRNFNRSFLFLDYEIWEDGNDARVRLAPPLPCPTDDCQDSAVSVAVGDARRLMRYAPRVLHLALRFRPPPALLRRVLANTSRLSLDEAACEAVYTHPDLAREWLTCLADSCDPPPHVRVYVCNREYYNDNFFNTIVNYWQSTNKSDFVYFDVINTTCSDTDDVSSDFDAVITNFSLNTRLHGVIAMGAAAASSLPNMAKNAGVPLLLVAAPPADVPTFEARSTSPAVAALALATRALLTACRWRRVALLREEGRCDQWKRSSGLGAALSELAGAELRLREVIVQERNESATLDRLKALDAHVVLLDGSAPTAARVLEAAQARGMSAAAGYEWLVLGAAGHSNDTDWRPNGTDFSYVTVSGGWRGGKAPAGLRGAGTLRARLEETLRGAWTPHAAALVDAMLLAREGVEQLRRVHPEYRHDPHSRSVDRAFFELLDKVTVEGVTHDIRANTSPPVFAHRWTTAGPRLVGVWGADDAAVDAAAAADLCGAVVDATVCRTTSSGDPFTPLCHDFAWAMLGCVAALAPPALVAAHVARRRRLARRDRRVEERALLRGGHSEAEAAAGAALAEHAVPRAALRLIDDLGAGHYGVVRLALLRLPACAALAVAAKQPRDDAPAGAAAELLREAALLATLRHEHVVRFRGVCWEGGPLVLMEHAFHGDLRRYLRQRRPAAERARDGLPEPEAAEVAAPALTRLAREAAAALGYLAHRRLVHRDVRAANCLVDARRSLKLADFGMARRLDGATAGDGAEYVCKRRAMFPVLWMSPESLARGVFSPATDVWALGVLLLELATLGERPFGAWSAARVVRHVAAGGAPPLPRDAAPSTRGVTALCWRRAPEQRPSAAELVAYLATHPSAVQPALALAPAHTADADADADADAPPTPDSGLYIDEWTVT